MKLEPVARLYQHDETGLTTVVDPSQNTIEWEETNPRWKFAMPLYAIPDGYVVVPVDHVLSKSELTQIDIWRDGAQDRYCYDPPKSEIDLQTKLEAMIAAKEPR